MVIRHRDYVCFKKKKKPGASFAALKLWNIYFNLDYFDPSIIEELYSKWYAGKIAFV